MGHDARVWITQDHADIFETVAVQVAGFNIQYSYRAANEFVAASQAIDKQPACVLIGAKEGNSCPLVDFDIEPADEGPLMLVPSREVNKFKGRIWHDATYENTTALYLGSLQHVRQPPGTEQGVRAKTNYIHVNYACAPAPVP